MIIRRGSAKKKHDARVVWLSTHLDAAIGVPGINEDVTDHGSARHEALRLTMHAAGLFGATNVTVQRETVRRLVAELRGEHTGVGW